MRYIEIAIIAGLLLVGFGTRDYFHQRSVQKELRREVAKANDVVKVEQKSDNATQQVATDVAKSVDRVQTVTRTIIKEVPVYVTREADTRCVITDGFVRLHDAAASATAPVPYSAGQSPDAPAGIEASTVSATVADNYGTCNVWREQVLGWQSWYASQRSLWPADAR